MRIGVISDTHGSMQAIQKAVQAAEQVELWLHAGDYSQDGEVLSSLTGAKVIAAKGNCDGCAKAKIDEFIQIGKVKIWITHGHRYGVKHDDKELLWWGREFEANVVIYGHTHIPDCRWVENILIFNPGSSAQPRFGNGTFGILEIDGEKVQAHTLEI